METGKVREPGKRVVKEAYGDMQCQARVFKLHSKSNGETSEGL